MPVGILSGIFAIFVLLKIVGAVLGEYLFEGIEGIIFCVNMTAIIISVVLGFITIYLSAFISAKKASKVNPIELLRNSGEIKIKRNKLKVPRIISKIFKTGGILAYKNLKRSKKKYRTTVISIAVSICIFITMNAFINNMFDFSEKYYEKYDYNMQIYSFDEEDVDYITKLEDIDDCFCLYQEEDYEMLRIYDKTKIEEELIQDFEYAEEETVRYVGIQVLGLDDATYRKYAKKAGLDYEKVKDTGILIDDYASIEVDDKGNRKEIEKRAYKYKVGDTIVGKYGKKDTTFENKKGIDKYENDKEIGIKVGAITKTRPYGKEKVYYYGGFLVVNVDNFKDIPLKLNRMLIQSSNADRLEENLNKLNGIGFTNIEKEVKSENSMILVVKIFLYGFISVITLIGVTNIFNTITSNMELRQKEFAMLKSVGMTKKEFNRMINLETIFYGTKSLIYGITLGMIGTYFIYQSFKNNITTFAFPTIAIAISVVAVFILIFVIMKYSVRKINKQNTIETIRKDNI
ncbi:MAG: ABC transporter permease [Clostridia bacterium]|nr:ABC transporter permease [Clostridia bacterium]